MRAGARLFAFGLAGAALLGGTGWAREATSPRILGISHVALRVSDLARSRAFYEGLLGLSTAKVDVNGTPRMIVTVSERQYIELRPVLHGEDRLLHVALETDDIEGLRKALEDRGLPIPPRSLQKNALGDVELALSDPEGNEIAFTRRIARAVPEAPPAGAPLSRHILHAGVIATDLAAANRFYGALLGFREIWRGSRSGTELSWTNLQVPDGTEYVELMLFAQKPAAADRGTAHHICLEVSDIEAARARLAERVVALAYSRPLEVRVGTNRKRQLNLYDPDGTRVELMEPGTVDGQPTPSSTAPPPGF